MSAAGGSATAGGTVSGGGAAAGGTTTAGGTVSGGGSSGGGQATAGGVATGGGSGVQLRPEDDGAVQVRRQTKTLPVPGGLLGGREVALTLFIPEQTSGAPVVVLHPGFQLAGSQYESYARHLATRGVVGIIADPPDALAGGPNHAELATYLGKVLDWVAVESADGGLAGIADPSKLIVGGHSMGGKIALLRSSTDTRPRGVFAIDPVDAAGGPLSQPGPSYPSVTPELMGSVHVPLVLIGETVNATCSGAFCQACAPSADNFQQYATHSSSPTVELELVGANHMSFIDNPNCGFTCSSCSAGTANDAEVRRLTRRYLTAFVDLVLRNDASARDWLAGSLTMPDVADGGVRLRTLNGF